MKYTDITKLKHLAQDKISRSANPAVVRNSTVFFKTMQELLDKEKVYFENIHQHFSKTKNYIEETKHNLNEIFKNYSGNISAYGTSIGATVFTYQFGLTEKIKIFFDDDPLRQNTLSPGIGAPVKKGRSPEMNEYKYCLLFAPLYADKIVRANPEFIKNEGAFITIRPKVSIVESYSDLQIT